MIKLKLNRDQVRIIERNFMPYMLQVCRLKIDEANAGTPEHLNWKIITCLMR